MVLNLFLTESSWKTKRTNGNGFSTQLTSCLRELEEDFFSLFLVEGVRSETRLWLCESVSSIRCLGSYQKKELFMNILSTKPHDHGFVIQLLQMVFEKMPHKAGSVLARRSYLLRKFFEGNSLRVSQWFSNFSHNGTSKHRNGAKALSHFAFVHRDICWMELEWKGKHGQSPAMVATKPHYFLDLNIEQTVQNFVQHVPEFWSSSEFSGSLKDGDILFIDSAFFTNLFIDLMHVENAKDVWQIIEEFFVEESFASLCTRLLITLDESDLLSALILLSRYINPRTTLPDYFDLPSFVELFLCEFCSSESIDQLLLSNAVIFHGRRLLRLLNDEEHHEENKKVKQTVSRIMRALSSAATPYDLLNVSSDMRPKHAIKFFGLLSWALHLSLLEECPSPESWETLFQKNGIGFKKFGKKSSPVHSGSLKDESDSDSRAHSTLKKRKRKERKKKRKAFVDEDYEQGMIGFGASVDEERWLLSIDNFVSSWSSADLPENLSRYCFSAWMHHLGQLNPRSDCRYRDCPSTTVKTRSRIY